MFHLYSAFRAKLAEWLASKGKTLKRPPVSEKSATFSQKPAPQPKTRAKAPTGAKSNPVIQTEAVKPTPALQTNNQTDNIKVPDNKPVNSSGASNIMNTTLDLLDNSDMDLPIDPEIRMESVRTIRVSYLSHTYIHACTRSCVLSFYNLFLFCSW